MVAEFMADGLRPNFDIDDLIWALRDDKFPLDVRHKALVAARLGSQPDIFAQMNETTWALRSMDELD